MYSSSDRRRSNSSFHSLSAFFCVPTCLRGKKIHGRSPPNLCGRLSFSRESHSIILPFPGLPTPQCLSPPPPANWSLKNQLDVEKGERGGDTGRRQAVCNERTLGETGRGFGGDGGRFNPTLSWSTLAWSRGLEGISDFCWQGFFFWGGGERWQ